MFSTTKIDDFKQTEVTSEMSIDPNLKLQAFQKSLLSTGKTNLVVHVYHPFPEQESKQNSV